MNFADSNHRLEEIEKELSELPIGYISRKVIRGKERFYHQWSENGKIKSRYLKAGEEEILRNQIERRKELQGEKKRLQTPLEKHTERQVNTVTSSITGYRLLRFVEDIHTTDNRTCFQEIKEFLSREDESRICILYGLHRTGKTTLLKQGMASLAPDQLRNTAYLSLHRGDQMSVLEQDLRNLQDAGFQFVFIDNITLLKDFIASASILADIFASMNMRLIIS
ncbi:MAG: AAA family ATPase, partial [Eubacteriales bacterium]|nr:AAA family ATPase [Eubacteriales bacterium]